MSTIQEGTSLRLGYLGSAAAAEAVVEAAGPNCGPVELVGVLPTDPFGPLRQRSVDVLLTRFVIDEPDLVTSPPLYEEKRILLVGRGHPLAGRASVSYEEVADYGVFARPPDMPEHTWEQIVPSRTPTGRVVRAAHTASNMLEMLEAIIAGTVVHPTVSSLAAWLQHPDVVFVPIDGLPAVPVALTWLARLDAGNDTGDVGPAVRAFVDAVLAGWPESSRVAP